MNKLQLQCKLGYLSRPDGSVLFSEGETTVIAGIYGPLEGKINKALMDQAVVEAHFRPKIGLPGVKDRVNESVIKNICETAIGVSFFPRTSVIVVVQEMQNSGQLLSCAVNAACLAALNSGIDMKSMFAAITCYLNGNAICFTRPVNQDEIEATFMFVFDSVKEDVLASQTEGSFSVEQYQNALSLCRKEITHVFEFFKSAVTLN